MDILYRKAKLEDKNDLYTLGVSLNKYNSKLPNIDDTFFWEGWEKDLKEEVDDDLANVTYKIYVAEVNKKIVGYVLAIICQDCKRCTIDQLFVLDEYRGKSIGKGLVGVIVKEARERGFEIDLEVYKENESAIKFYKSLGFKEQGLVLRLS